MATTKDDYSPTKTKTTTVATQTAAAKAAAAKAASIRAAQAAEARAKANSAIATAEAKAKTTKYTPPITTQKTVGTVGTTPKPTVVNPNSMAPSPSELAAQAAAQRYAQVQAEAKAREAAIAISPTIAPPPPSSNSQGPYNPYIPSSGAVVPPVKSVGTAGADAKVARAEEAAAQEAAALGITAYPWTETAMQGDVGNWEKDKLKGEMVTTEVWDAATKQMKTVTSWKPYWKNYADWALDKYGAGAPGFPSEAYQGGGPVKPDLPTGYVYTPIPEVVSYGDGGDTSGGEESSGGELSLEQPVLPDITWSAKYTVDGAPSWWQGFVPSRNDPQSEYATMLNAMIPFMSPEDQRYTASMLYRLYPDAFANYNPVIQGMPAIPTDMTTNIRQTMTSAARANSVLDTLNKVKSVSGSDTKFGPGFAYLQQLGSLLRDFGNTAGNGQTRQQYEQFASAYDPLAAETKQENLSAFSELTRMLAQPYYSAGKVTPTSTLSNGAVIPGEVNKSWF